MSRPQRSSMNATEKDQAEEPQKRYRFELGTARLVTYCFGLVVCLSWMFVLGLLVGRGVPFVGPVDFSLRAELLRFVGLGRQVPEPPRNVAETWEDPKKILQSLSYYEDLTKKGGGPSSSLAKAAPHPKDSVPKGQTTNPPPHPQAQPAPNPPSPPPQADSSPAQTAPTAQKPTLDSLKEQGHSEPPGDRFTLLISSLRDIENAHRLVEQLRSKGYSPRLDSLDLSESGRWNRVIMGSFPSREEAQRFAADFNRKERMEAMVIRETD